MKQKFGKRRAYQSRFYPAKQPNAMQELLHLWADMNARCVNEKHADYPQFGAKGVRVCEEWQRFADFRAWALAQDYQYGMVIFRRDASGNYEPANCYLSTAQMTINREMRRHS